MNYHYLSNESLESQVVGEIALATVLALMAAAVVAVVIYKLFMSSKGGATIPGGWKFSWAE